MKHKINNGFLIVSIAMSLIIFGISAALTFRYGYEIGLPIGLGAFLLLISVMLILNRRSEKKRKKKHAQTEAQQDNPEP